MKILSAGTLDSPVAVVVAGGAGGAGDGFSIVVVVITALYNENAAVRAIKKSRKRSLGERATMPR